MVSAGGGPENYWFNILQDSSANEYILDDNLFDSQGNLIVAGVIRNDQYHFWHRISKDGDILTTKTINETGSSADNTSIAVQSLGGGDKVIAALGNARYVVWDFSDNLELYQENTLSGGPYGDSGTGYGSLVLEGNTLYDYSFSGSQNQRAIQASSTTGYVTSTTSRYVNSSNQGGFFGIGGFSKNSQGDYLCGSYNSSATNNDNWWVITNKDLSQHMAFYNGGGGAICRAIEYSNGNWYIVGMRQTDNSFAQDPVILKVGTWSGSGNQGVLWAKRARHVDNTSNGAWSGQFYDVAIDSLGDIYAVGSTYAGGGSDSGGIILKYNSNGTMIWARRIYHSGGTVAVNKIKILNDTMWININVNNQNTCAVAKLPTTGDFIGIYGSLTVTDWSSSVVSNSNQFFTHTNQNGSTPALMSTGNSANLGSPSSFSYTEPTLSPTEDAYVAGVISSITESATSFNEGQQLDVDITTVDSDDGTVLYWKVISITGTVNASDFSAFSGSVTVSSNAAQISITMTNDSATEGTEQFVIKIYSESQYTNVLGTTRTITINDTSTAPVQHTHYSGSVGVPANAYDIHFECAGGAGGDGAATDNGTAGSNGGSGRSSHFSTNLNPPFTVGLYPGTKGNDGAGGNSATGGGTNSAGMNGGTGGGAGGNGAGSYTGNVSGGGGGGAGSGITISGYGWVAVAGGGGGGGGSTPSSVGDDGGNGGGYGGSTAWTTTTSSISIGAGGGAYSGGDNDDNAAGGGGGGGAPGGSAGSLGGINGSSVGQGGSSGSSVYRSDIMSQGSNSHNPGSDGWAVLYYKTP